MGELLATWIEDTNDLGRFPMKWGAVFWRSREQIEKDMFIEFPAQNVKSGDGKK